MGWASLPRIGGNVTRKTEIANPPVDGGHLEQQVPAEIRRATTII
jgi:hypothetical protein